MCKLFGREAFNEYKSYGEGRIDGLNEGLEFYENKFNITNQPPKLFFKEYKSSDLYLRIELTNLPRDIIFYTDEVSFRDGNINLTFGEKVGMFNFDNFDRVIWNIGNRSWTYKKIKVR